MAGLTPAWEAPGMFVRLSFHISNSVFSQQKNPETWLQAAGSKSVAVDERAPYGLPVASVSNGSDSRGSRFIGILGINGSGRLCARYILTVVRLSQSVKIARHVNLRPDRANDASGKRFGVIGPGHLCASLVRALEIIRRRMGDAAQMQIMHEAALIA